MKAVIPAAGLGTRMLPATKAIPKEMLPVAGKPAIQHVVEEAVGAGFNEILIVTGRGKHALEDHFDRNLELESHLKASGKIADLERIETLADLGHIHYVRQKEPLGLGHAILCARDFVSDEPFAVLLGDDLMLGGPQSLRDLHQAQKSTNLSTIAVSEVAPADVSRYGIIGQVEEGPSRNLIARQMVEKPALHNAPSQLAAMGRYVLKPDIFDVLQATPRGVGGEVQLTDALATTAEVEGLCAVRVDGQRLDAGDWRGWLLANVRMAMHDEKLRLAIRQIISGTAPE